MKRIFLILAASAFLFSSCNTNQGVSKAFSKYSHEDGVTSITVPGWFISIAGKIADLNKTERELLQSIDKVKVLAIENDELNARINLHDEFHSHINRNNDYEELLTVRDDRENVTIFGKMDKEVITEMVILVGGDENVMVYLKGELKPELLNNTIDLSKPDKFLSLNF